MKTLAQHLKATSMELDFLFEEINHCIEDDMDSYDVIYDALHMIFDSYCMGQATILITLAQLAKTAEIKNV